MKQLLLFTIAVSLSSSCWATEPAAASHGSNTKLNYSWSNNASAATDRPTAHARHWIDSSGRFQVEAVLVNFDASAVTLRRFDEIEVRVPRDPA